MTFRQLAFNNVKGSWQRYLAYFLSCAFSVMVFYLYASFMMHPAVQAETGEYGMGLVRGLWLCEFIVVIFSILFILFSNTAFMRSRKKEFGLLTLMGATQGQIRYVTFVEGMITALLATVVGLGFGVLFSKLFFMALGVLMALRSDVYFTVPLKAVGLTTGVYLTMFVVLNVISMVQVRQSSVKELLKASRQPRVIKHHSLILLLFGVGLVAMGYRRALLITTRTLAVEYMISIVLLTVAGSYFLFTQGIPLVVRLLQRRKKVYLTGVNTVQLNRLYFRLRDSANLMFVMAVLVAVVISSLGAINTVLQNAKGTALQEHLFSLGLRVSGESSADQALKDMRNLSEAHGHDVSNAAVIDGYRYQVKGAYQFSVLVVSESQFRAGLVHIPQVKDIRLNRGEAIAFAAYLVIESNNGFAETMQSQPWSIVGAESLGAIQVTTAIPSPFVRGDSVFVMADADVAELLRMGNAPAATKYLGLEIERWEKSAGLTEKLYELDAVKAGGFYTRYEAYQILKLGSSALLFIGMFISILFFLASGSLIYFKLFTELGEDRRQFKILRDVGMSYGEMYTVVTRELGMLFFLPVTIGFVHSAFALKSLSNLLSFSITRAGIMTCVVYALLQLVYFLLTRNAYLKRVTAL